MEYVIFDKDWLDIPMQDYPVGKIAICHDPPRRLGPITWAVVYVRNSDPAHPLGLFWDKEEAIRYAEGISEDIEYYITQRILKEFQSKVDS